MTLWGYKTKLPPFSANVNGRMKKVDLAVLEKLIERSELFNYKNKHFYLFAKSGFTKGCIRKAEEMGNVRLVEYSEMLKEVK